MEKEYYVYLHIKETTDEPFYVGKGKGYRATRKAYRTEHWNNIVSKHGYDVIMLEENLTEEESFELEIYWIKRIGRRDLGLGPLINYSDGGEGTSGYKHSEESKKKMSDSRRGNDTWNKGLKMSEEYCRNVGKSSLGRTHSEKTKSKMSESRKEKPRVDSKLILDTHTGIFYESITQASNAYNINRRTLSDKLTGKCKNNTSLILA